MSDYLAGNYCYNIERNRAENSFGGYHLHYIR